MTSPRHVRERGWRRRPHALRKPAEATSQAASQAARTNPIACAGCPTTQRGAATLTITALLAACMALAVLFAHRALIFEQRSAANQHRAARAFELAEAGLEWATAALNDPRFVDARCEPDPTGTDLRSRLLGPGPARGFAPPADLRWGCRVEGEAWRCECPAPGMAPELGDRAAGGFVLQFEPASGDPEALRVSATACSEIAAPCGGLPGDEPADAQASASVVLKLAPLLRVVPGAALTAVGDVQLGSGAFDAPHPQGGRIVEAGGAIDPGRGRLSGPPGTPPGFGLTANDPSLAALQAQAPDSGMGASLGRDFESLPLAPGLWPLRAATPQARGLELAAAVAEGWFAFSVDGPLLWPDQALGTTERPLLLVSTATIACDSPPCRLTGLLIGSTAEREPHDLDGFSIDGAVWSLGHHRSHARLDVRHDPAALQTLRLRSAVLQPVPGSWSDH